MTLKIFKIKKSIFLFFLLLFGLSLLQAQNTNVYVSAHPDDWQLFMNPNAYRDLQNSENKVVFLHTTAGDAGNGTGNTSYYLAREEGSLRAIRFLCNAINYQLKQGAQMSRTQVIINGHTVLRYAYSNAVVYFLRLPDGNVNGVGYPVHKHQSLQRFYEGTAIALSSIDHSTTYQSKDELIQTITALIRSEASSTGEIELNIADTNEEINPNDHSDHRHSSFFMQKVATELNLRSVRMYQEYFTNTKEMNVFGDDFLICAGTWGATVSGLSDNYHHSTWDESHNAWIGRQYLRKVLLSELPDE
jgi:hypothetical protein